VVHVVLPAGKEVAMPAAVYASMRQLVWVLEGTLSFTEGDILYEMAAGDCLELGPPVDCVFRNDGVAPCRYAVMLLKVAAA
jgi:uncharacterized cupin superfamily protein